jgi:hypothetical protein
VRPFEEMDIEPIFGDIDSDGEHHSRTHPCRYGLARGGPGDCSGQRNAADRALAHPRPLGPRGRRARGRPSGIASFAALTPRCQTSRLYRH